MVKSTKDNQVENLLENENGMVLVLAVLVLVLISVWGAASLVLSTNEYQISHSSLYTTQAYYLAEAGLEEGIVKVKEKIDAKNNGLIDNLNFDESDSIEGQLEIGRYQATITKEDMQITIISTGEVKGFEKMLSAVMTLIKDGEDGIPNLDDLEGFDDFDMENPDHQSEGDLTFDGRDSTVDGDILVEGNLVVKNTNSDGVGGNIYVGGNVEIDENINGGIDANIFVGGDLKIKNINDSGIKGNIYVLGDADIDLNINGGLAANLYVAGDLRIKNINYGGIKGKICVRGNAYLDKNINGGISGELYIWNNLIINDLKYGNISSKIYVKENLTVTNSYINLTPEAFICVGGIVNTSGNWNGTLTYSTGNCMVDFANICPNISTDSGSGKYDFNF